MEKSKRKRPFSKKQVIKEVQYFGPSDLEEVFTEFEVEGYGSFLVNNYGTKIYGKSKKLLTVTRNENGYLQIHTGTHSGKKYFLWYIV